MKAVLFDFDFTLADASTGILECYRHALSTSGLAVPDDPVILRTVGMSLHDTFSLLAPDSDIDRLLALFKERADQVMADSTRVFADVPDVLGALKERGYATGIVSSKFRYRIEQVLVRESIRHLFDIIVGGEDVTKFKPDPEGIHAAVKGLACEPSEAVYIGDAVVDAQASVRAGTEFIAVCTGATTRDELLQHGVRRTVDRLCDVPLALGMISDE